jgi:SAM-dependent methyltransferase
MHRNSRRIFSRFAAPVFFPGARVLEIGPDRDPSTYRGLVPVDVGVWDTLDIPQRTDIPITFHALSEYEFPIEDGRYDIVLSGQVIEHVRKIWRWMPELTRVCRPGGRVVTINPVSWHYHDAPIDCWRIYPEGMRALCDDAGLEVELSWWGCLELEGVERRSPRPLRKHRVWQRLSGLLGVMNAAVRFPVEGAYDTITIARKPERG